MPLPETLSQFSNALNPACSEELFNSFSKLVNAENDNQALARLNIYRRSISHSHVDTLLSVFPVCANILGEKLFSHWGKSYLWAETSSCSDLNLYGRSFPEFISEQLKTASFADDYRYLPDLARLEYHWNQAFFLPDDPQFDFDLFAEQSATSANIIFQPAQSLFLMESSHPVFEIFDACKNNILSDSVPAISDTELICIYRPEFIPQGAIISPQEYSLLSACQKGMSLAEIESHSELSGSLTLLPELIKNGKITDFYQRSGDV